MGKLKASIKSFHEAISNLGPTETICVQEAKTIPFSFREGDGSCSSYSYINHHPPTFSSSSPFGLQKLQEGTRQLPKVLSSSPSSFSSCLAKTTEQKKKLFPDGRISSNRFFFSPRNTNSIMEEVKQTGGGKAAAAGSFYEGSLVMPMVSEDPYGDFKRSMAEMVEAHGLSDWRKLQELLHCYLRLNDRKNHKVIVLAFVDLLMHLMAHDRNIFPISSAPLCLSFCALDM